MLEINKDRQTVNGNGSKTVFNDFDFYIQNNTDIEVYIIDTVTGDKTLQELTTDYSVSSISVDPLGFTITFVTAPTATEQVFALRKIPLTQLLDIAAVTDFDERKLMRALDKITAIAQQLSGDVARTIKTADESTITGLALPATLTPGSAIKINATGDGVELTDTDIDEAIAAAEASEAAALSSQNAAAASAAAALSSKNAAAASAAAALLSEGNASDSEIAAAASESNASDSAGTATTQAGIATTQAGNALASANNAESYKNLALGYKDTASAQATIATTKAGEASDSADAAAISAGTATTKAGEASDSASDAAQSALDAQGYAADAQAAAQGTIQVTGKILSSGSWSLVSGLYEYDLSDANITVNSVVDVVPDNADISVVRAALILPKTLSSAGSVKLYASNAPSANIGCTLNIRNAS